MRSIAAIPLVPLVAAAFFLLARPAPVAEAGTAVRMSIAELATGADLVLEARVTALRASKDERGRVETELVLDVGRTLWGEALPVRSVRVPGGVLPDGSGMLLAGMPRFRVGEEALLFLSAPGGTGIRVPVGLSQGVLEVVRTASGEKLLVRPQPGLALADPATGEVVEAPAHSVRAYAQVLAEVEAALAARRAAGSEGR